MSGNNCPFSSASEYACWTNQNCDHCSKFGNVGVQGSSGCEIFEAIHNAAIGIAPNNLAIRFGEIENESFLIFRDCSEREAQHGN